MNKKIRESEQAENYEGEKNEKEKEKKCDIE